MSFAAGKEWQVGKGHKNKHYQSERQGKACIGGDRISPVDDEALLSQQGTSL